MRYELNGLGKEWIFEGKNEDEVTRILINQVLDENATISDYLNNLIEMGYENPKIEWTELKESFQSLVESVEENNKMHEVNWNTWENAKHIQSIYGTLKDEYKEIAETFLNALIRDNGENLHVYLDAMDALEYGYLFSR